MSSIDATSGSFEQEFQDRYRSIKRRGADVGMSVSDICTAAGVSRATPERWKKRSPLTVRLIDRMDAAVAAVERQRAAQ